MNTKQIVIVIVSLVIGFALGKFIFKDSKTEENSHKNETVEAHWTCSMHPQIDMPKFGKCPICGMDLIPKDGSNANDNSLSSNTFKMTKNAIALANVETITVGSGDIQKTTTEGILKLSGKIQANDKASSIQTAHFGGRLERLVYKSIGEYVSKGSLIASVYSPELVTAQNEFIEALAIKNAQPELYKAVRNKLRNWKISEKQIQQIENDKKVITNFNMYANVAGYIDEILVEEGSHVKEGSPLFKVSNLASVWAVFDVYEKDIKNLKIGQKVKIKLNAYPDKTITSKINFIDPILNTATRTIAVRATLNNRDKKLKPGMLLSSDVQLSKTMKNGNLNIVEIPKTAVMWTGKRSVVYIKPNKNESIFELREVTLGSDNGSNYTILSGLKNGDEVVVNGTFTVDAAAQLQGKNSMMNSKKRKEIKDKSRREKMQAQVAKRINVNPTFKKKLNIVFNDYLAIKDAFVLTDTKKVKEHAAKTISDLKNVKMKFLKKPEAHKIWMAALPILKASLESLTTETDIAKQRTTFIDLSKTMINLANGFGTDKIVYVEHCPMANENKGADWLSTEKTIKNPYFGEKMLQCGSVEQTIE